MPWEVIHKGIRWKGYALSPQLPGPSLKGLCHGILSYFDHRQNYR